MAEKCKKIVLTVKQKLKLTKKFENRELVTKLARDYRIGIQIICDIKNNKMKLMEFVRDCDSGAGRFNPKNMKKSSHKEVNVAFLSWFNQKQAGGTSVSGPMYAEKAKFLHEALGLEGDFNASVGWLTRFKCIHETAVQEQILSVNDAAANTFHTVAAHPYLTD
jgi:hypothetical protein